MSSDGRYTIRLDADMIAAIDDLRRVGDMPGRSEMIRRLVGEAIDSRQKHKSRRQQGPRTIAPCVGD